MKTIDDMTRAELQAYHKEYFNAGTMAAMIWSAHVINKRFRAIADRHQILSERLEREEMRQRARISERVGLWDI